MILGGNKDDSGFIIFKVKNTSYKVEEQSKSSLTGSAFILRVF